MSGRTVSRRGQGLTNQSAPSGKKVKKPGSTKQAIIPEKEEETIQLETVMNKLSHLWNGDEKQVNLLLNATFQDGTKVLNTDVRESISTIVDVLIQNSLDTEFGIGFDSIYDLIVSSKNMEDFIFERSNIMLEAKNVYNLELNMQRTEEVGIKNILGDCRKCHNKELVVGFSQTRSADEGFTSLFRCVACGESWSK